MAYNKAYNIATTQSAITYPSIALIAPVDGINYFKHNWRHVDTYTYTGSTNTGSLNKELISTNAHYSTYCLYHITGTFTHDITDNVVFYYLANTWPRNDQVIIIPVKPYQSEISFDFIDITNINTNAYNCYRIYCVACDKDFNTVPSDFSISITVDYYTM